MALKADGTVVVWGYNDQGETEVPAGLSNVVAIAAGSFHSLARTESGNVVIWGRPGEPLNVPPSLTNVIAMADGLFYSTAVKADGRLVTWGDNTYGEANVPITLTNAACVAAGWYHAIAATTDGSVVAADTASTVPPGLSNVVAVGIGFYDGLVLEQNPMPASQARFSNPCVNSGRFGVSVPTESGRVYRLEYKTSLTDDSWTPLPLTAGTGNLKVLSDPQGTGSQRFYRVRRW